MDNYQNSQLIFWDKFYHEAKNSPEYILKTIDTIDVKKTLKMALSQKVNEDDEDNKFGKCKICNGQMWRMDDEKDPKCNYINYLRGACNNCMVDIVEERLFKYKLDVINFNKAMEDFFENSYSYLQQNQQGTVSVGLYVQKNRYDVVDIIMSYTKELADDLTQSYNIRFLICHLCDLILDFSPSKTQKQALII